MVKHSLSIRIFLVTLLCFALPTLVYFFFVFRGDYHRELLDNYFFLLENGRCRAAGFQELYHGRLLANTVLIETLNLGKEEGEADSKRIDEVFKQLSKETHLTALVYLAIQPDGKIVGVNASDKSYIGQDFSSYAYVQEAVKKGHFGFLAYGWNNDEKHFFTLNTVYSEKDHRPVGIIANGSLVDEVLTQILQYKVFNYKINFAIASSDDIVFASSDPSFDLIMLRKLSPERLEEIKKGKEIGVLINNQADVKFVPIEGMPGAYKWEWQGIKRLGAKIPIEQLGLSLIVYANEDDIFRKQYESLYRFVLLFCLITAVAAWFTFWLTGKLAKPLNRLHWVMRKVGKGDYSARFVKGKMGFEINDIGITLNQMIDDLLKHMEAVKNERVEKETLANELKIGRSIQLSILPQEMPVFPEADLAAGTFPAKEVGGDFYDLYVLENPEDEDKHKLVLTIADAAGKGISACLYSLCLRSMLRSYLIESSDLGKSVRLANNLFFLDTEKSSMFVTAFLGLFDCQTREFEFFCAGHHPTILRRADGTIEFLSTGHMALGVMPLDELSHKKVILNPGDLLVFYTDGVVEALNKRDEGYGEARLIDVIEQHANQPVSEIWHEIVADINRFAQDAPQHDDITLIVMRVL